MGNLCQRNPGQPPRNRLQRRGEFLEEAVLEGTLRAHVLTRTVQQNMPEVVDCSTGS